MKFILSLCFTLMTISGFSQFGVRISYNINNAPQWNEFFRTISSQDIQVFKSSLTYTLDYWIRLPNHRIEFYPNISYHQSSGELPGLIISTPPNELLEIGFRQIGAGVLSHIYLLDLVGDCECPTFSKKGGFFKKGFFLAVGIGTDYSQKAYEGNYRDGNIDFKASLGAGIDFGINDLITISPFLQYQYYPTISWHEVGSGFTLENRDVESSFGQMQIGVRMGFRPDYKRPFSR